jgi:hypothetical protein
MVHAYPPSRRRLARGGAPHRSPVLPLTVIGPNKTGQSGLYSFGQGLTVPIHFVWQHILVTPLGNILKSTFDTLTEEGRKAFEAYHSNLEELFLFAL